MKEVKGMSVKRLNTKELNTKDLSIKGLVKGLLTEKENRRYQRCLEKRRTTYGQWLTAQEK